jgi:phage-related protein
MAGRTQAVYYRDKAGREPVNVFLEELARSNPQAAAKVDEYVEQYLNGRPAGAPPPEHPVSSQVDGELRELRVRFGKTRYRVLYRRSGLLVVLLHIFEKNTGKLPARDRELAIRRFADFKARMGAEPRRPPRAAGRDAPPRERGR